MFWLRLSCHAERAESEKKKKKKDETIARVKNDGSIIEDSWSNRSSGELA